MQAGSSTFKAHLNALKLVALRLRVARGERVSKINVNSEDFYHPPTMAMESLKKKAELGIKEGSEYEESGLRALEERSLWFSVVRHPFEHFASAYWQLCKVLQMRKKKRDAWKDMMLQLKMNMRWVS